MSTTSDKKNLEHGFGIKVFLSFLTSDGFFSFKYSVLLWDVNTRCLMNYSFRVCKIHKILIYKFRAIISSKNFNFFIVLSFNKVCKILKVRKNFTFIFIKYNQVALEKSSMKITKYLNPLYDSTGAGPHTSE